MTGAAGTANTGAGKVADDLAALASEAARQTALAQDALTRLAVALQGPVNAPLKRPVKRRVKAPFEGPSTEAAWRAAHRSGRPSRLDSDPELRAFVLSRIDGLTFDAIARDIAAAFPPARRVSRSTLHRWWHRNRQKMPADTACYQIFPDSPGQCQTK